MLRDFFRYSFRNGKGLKKRIQFKLCIYKGIHTLLFIIHIIILIFTLHEYFIIIIYI